MRSLPVFAHLLRLLLFCFIFTPAAVYAQTPGKVTIQGNVLDTSGTSISFATVMLLNPKDSTLVNFSRTDDKGGFAFKNIKNQAYIFKVSYVGYLPYQLRLEPHSRDVHDLGVISIKPIAQELMEVVIRTAKAPLNIRGDTVEYDASMFKVPPGSTVEDLLRRLPGIELDADGNIKAQGKDVKRVYVDGKTFFGDDPKAATKNLGAETITKVQVFNEKSEQAKLTGVDDGKKEKAINLELKDEYKKGSFGKITVAAGDQDRWAARGNYNRFNTKQQLSFIGYGNNINQTGINWEDYGEFKGQNAFNDNDNADFGFSTGGNWFYYTDDEDSPLNNFDGRGFTKNFGAGSNYNYDHKKTKLNLSYFYNQTDLTIDQYTFRQNFLPEGTFTNQDTMLNADFRSNHSLNTRLEQSIDSSTTLIVKASGRLGQTNPVDRRSQYFIDPKAQPLNILNVDNEGEFDNLKLNSLAIFRHRFKKKGRSTAVSATYNMAQSDGTETVFSLNRFFNAETPTDQFRQLNATDNNTRQLKASAIYTDAFSKKWYWETFYNFSQTLNEADRQVSDRTNGETRVDSLSAYYDNTITYNRLGSSIRYSHQGLNLSWGLAAQQLALDGRISRDKGLPLLTAPIKREFNNLIPYFNLGWELSGGVWLSSSYSYDVKEPQLRDLQPVVNAVNPAFRSEGNPNLGPERSQTVDAGFHRWNASTFSSISINGDYTWYDQQIVYNQIIETVDSVGIRTTTRPVNVSGGNRFNVNLWMNFPIIKTKLTMNINGGFRTGQAPAFVNNVENTTQNDNYRTGITLNATLSDKLILSAGGNINFNRISYSIQSNQNQDIQNHSADVSVKWQFAPLFFFEGRYTHSFYRNDRFDFNQDVPIVNASVRRLVGRNNRFEIRLAAFDLLNRRVSITQQGTANYVTRQIAETLARYYMLSVSYNIKGYENKLNKNNWW